ncbi:MAG: hypothetical protein LBJ57_06360 [Prevotellaceae bacterium]|jgi:hypothetical protein|nr:hypothetical protein [Prevotellaceae bacterium]
MKIAVPIFDVTVFVYSCSSVHQFMRRRGYEVGSERRTAKACTFYERGASGAMHLCSVFGGGAGLSAGTVVHEAVHIVSMIFQMKGVAPDLDNDEVQAYLTAFVFNEVSKLLWKQIR